MKFLLQAAIWCFLVVCIKSQNLACSTGTVTITPPGSSPMDTRKSVQCPSNNKPQNCLRVETTLGTTSGVSADITFALCVNDTVCMTDCDSLVPFLIEDLFETRLPATGFADVYTIRDCKRACCKTDNCNDQSVETILQSQREMIPGGAEKLLNMKQPLMALLVILSFLFGNIVS